MSVTVEISNHAALKRVRSLLGARSDAEAADLALEKVLEAYEPVHPKTELPQDYWDDLFSEPQLPAEVVKKALEKEREDRS